jgi:chromosome partitioning protein
MKTLVTAIQKGGQGKTCTTCHLAFDFMERGLRVAVLDLDTQGNASYTLSAFDVGFAASKLFSTDKDAVTAWVHNYKSEPGGSGGIALFSSDALLANLDKMEWADAAKVLKTNLQAISERFDVCLIDTPPSLGVAMTAAVLAAEYMLSPLEMEAYSLHGMKKMVSVIGNLRQLNPSLRFLGMIPNKVDSRKPRHVNNLKQLQAAYPQLVVPFCIGARDSIAEALGDKRPVWKVRKTAARQASLEMRTMTEYVFGKMEITHE